MDRCTGCIEEESCTIKDAKKESQCPCRICLVKMVCKKACLLWETCHAASFYKRQEGLEWQKVDIG
jgi:hypothetical protein